MRSLVVVLLVALFSIAATDRAWAEPRDGTSLNPGPSDATVLALITDDDLFSVMDLSVALAAPMTVGGAGATQHYGPFASGSPDSGTCGNDWAQDTFDRHFTVRQDAPTTYTVVQQFKNGSFVTNPGLSPGACQLNDGSSTTLVAGGLTGTLHGYFVITVTGTQTSTDPSCVAGNPSAPCTTTGFITSHFGGASTIGTFFFHYAGQDGTNQVLIEKEWKNASDDRGGNHGDIATQ